MNTFLEARRRRVAEAWSLGDALVVVGSGQIVPKPGYADQSFPFRAHAEHFYLTDRERPDSILAFDPHDGFRDFVPPITDEDRVWTGDVPDAGEPVEGFAAWLAARAGRPIAALGSLVAGVTGDPALTPEARETLLACRRPKDAEELDRMRRAAAATAEGYRQARALLRPGLTERQLQIELEAGFFRGGGDRTAYDSIVGTGSNAAVLHFSPSSRRIAAGDLVLIDAGAEVDVYCADVTRTLPASGKFSPEQRDLYAVVLAAEERACAKCKPGKEFRELHLECAADLAQGLVDMGILRGNAQTLVETDAYALFFPHGLGHLVGLGVRDASGYLPGRTRSTRPSLRYLRQDLPLGEGFVTTIEPGLYFIPALLNHAELRARHKDQVNWELAERFLPIGGVRIEDNILVTSGEPENLTAAIPKQIAELER
jgi:Xaa-Pro aminopeptidase